MSFTELDEVLDRSPGSPQVCSADAAARDGSGRRTALKALVGGLVGIFGMSFRGNLVGAAAPCECVVYLRDCIKAINGGPQYAKDYAKAAGYTSSKTPQAGWVLVLQPGTNSAKSAGHVAWVRSNPSKKGSTWTVPVKHANWDEGKPFNDCNCSNVTQKDFQISQSDLDSGRAVFIKKK